MLALGKLALNLFKVDAALIASIQTFFEATVPMFHALGLTLSALNERPMTPRKDYHTNRLVSGPLQLANGTHLILDETQLTTGTLQAQGLANMSAIQQMIQWGKVAFDFDYYKVEMDVNIHCLVLSEGKSMLTCDVLLPVIPAPTAASCAPLTEDQLVAVRQYLDLVRFLPYDIPDALRKVLVLFHAMFF